jgi:hypothetical protein
MNEKGVQSFLVAFDNVIVPNNGMAAKMTSFLSLFLNILRRSR